jgi:hypothetical protein
MDRSSGSARSRGFDLPPSRGRSNDSSRLPYESGSWREDGSRGHDSGSTRSGDSSFREFSAPRDSAPVFAPVDNTRALAQQLKQLLQRESRTEAELLTAVFQNPQVLQSLRSQLGAASQLDVERWRDKDFVTPRGPETRIVETLGRGTGLPPVGEPLRPWEGDRDRYRDASDRHRESSDRSGRDSGESSRDGSERRRDVPGSQPRDLDRAPSEVVVSRGLQEPSDRDRDRDRREPERTRRTRPSRWHDAPPDVPATPPPVDTKARPQQFH